MSTIIKFDLKELRKLVSDKNSCVVEKKVTQNLALQPWCLGNLKESIKNLLDYKIGKFDKEFNGILLSYKNLRVLQNVGIIRNDNADINFQVQADYFIFRPYVGATLKGVVNKKSITHLGVLVHRVFNVVIPRPTEEPGNKWIGTGVQEGQEVSFRIVVLDLYGALPYIRGELDERWLKFGADGDDEVIETKPAQSLSVSYIDFDKTKPNVQKQNKDDFQDLMQKNNFKILNSNKHQQKSINGVINKDNQSEVNGKSNISQGKNVESIVKGPQKVNTKRLSKMLDSDKQQIESNPRYSKKHKKDS